MQGDQKSKKQDPGSLFTKKGFKKEHKRFFKLIKSLVSKKYVPTFAHALMKVLDDAGLLLRVYTQNIDGLELLANVPAEKVIQIHGHLRSSRCINEQCEKSEEDEECDWNTLLENNPIPCCGLCGDLLRPGIVFFGKF